MKTLLRKEVSCLLLTTSNSSIVNTAIWQRCFCIIHVNSSAASKEWFITNGLTSHLFEPNRFICQWPELQKVREWAIQYNRCSHIVTAKNKERFKKNLLRAGVVKTSQDNKRSIIQESVLLVVIQRKKLYQQADPLRKICIQALSSHLSLYTVPARNFIKNTFLLRRCGYLSKQQYL